MKKLGFWLISLANMGAFAHGVDSPTVPEAPASAGCSRADMPKSELRAREMASNLALEELMFLKLHHDFLDRQHANTEKLAQKADVDTRALFPAAISSAGLGGVWALAGFGLLESKASGYKSLLYGFLVPAIGSLGAASSTSASAVVKANESMDLLSKQTALFADLQLRYEMIHSDVLLFDLPSGSDRVLLKILDEKIAAQKIAQEKGLRPEPINLIDVLQSNEMLSKENSLAAKELMNQLAEPLSSRMACLSVSDIVAGLEKSAGVFERLGELTTDPDASRIKARIARNRKMLDEIKALVAN